MSKFTITELHAAPKTLSRHEVDVVLEATDYVLKNSGIVYPTKGTLIIDGQTKDQKAQCILRLNLSDGAWLKNFSDLYDRSSDNIAANSIDEALSWPDRSRYVAAKDQALHFGWLPSGVYHDRELNVLVLNTTLGRFLISLCANFESSVSDDQDTDMDTTSVLFAIAAIIGRMGSKDETLQHSVENIRTDAAGKTNTIEIVDSFFDGGHGEKFLGLWRVWSWVNRKKFFE